MLRVGVEAQPVSELSKPHSLNEFRKVHWLKPLT
jgi:hypothetical protein